MSVMNWKNAAQVALATVALMAGSHHAGAGITNLVTNGNFELNGGLGQIGYNTTLSGWTLGSTIDGSLYAYDFIANGNADSTGFPSVNGTIKLYGPSNGVNNGFSGSPDGGNFLGVDPSYATAPLSQQINGLIVGNQYTLSFQWAAGQYQAFNGATQQSWQVSLGSDTRSTGVNNVVNHGFSGWSTENFVFTASSTSETLKFLAQGGPQATGPITLLDGVSLTANTAAVPEPGTLVMAGLLSMGGGLVAVRRAKAKSKNANIVA